MEEVVLINKQIIIRFIPPLYTTSQPSQAKYVMKYSNRDLLAKVTKNLAINIRLVVIKG